jgi:hypothetical protein
MRLNGLKTREDAMVVIVYLGQLSPSLLIIQTAK